jgi:hypothetical protein
MFEIELEDMGNYITLETNLTNLEEAIVLASSYCRTSPLSSIAVMDWMDHRIFILTPELKRL